MGSLPHTVSMTLEVPKTFPRYSFLSFGKFKHAAPRGRELLSTILVCYQPNYLANTKTALHIIKTPINNQVFFFSEILLKEASREYLLYVSSDGNCGVFYIDDRKSKGGEKKCFHLFKKPKLAFSAIECI